MAALTTVAGISVLPALLKASLLVVVAACARTGAEQSTDAAPTTSQAPSVAPPSPSRTPAPPPKRPAREPTSDLEPPVRPEPRRSFMTIPALGVRDVAVERYRGSPDDGLGTRIQDTGVMASPRGPDGGVGPGVVGNYIVTGHRTSHGAPLADLPRLEVGARVVVRTGDRELVYRITRTRSTSFRSEASLARQSAAVPGRPGATPTRPMLTLSTCATPEDHAVGNFWADEFNNPEHRIDKIGVLTRSRPVG